MTIDQTNVIDFVAFKKDDGDVLLVISDHLPWDQDEGEHLLLLQDKLNAYLQFIENGQIYKEYPELRGRPLVIRIAGMHPLSEQARTFFKLAKNRMREAGYGLEFELRPKP